MTTITEAEIYRLAHRGAFSIWGSERDRLKRMPDNETLEAREAKAWEQLMAIEEAARAKGILL